MFGFNAENEQSGEDMLKHLMDQLRQGDSVLRARINDTRLMRLAKYDTTHGYMKMPIIPEQLLEKFLEFKGYVKRGSFTLKTLEDDVYSRWGIQEETREDIIRKALGKEQGVDNYKRVIGFHPDNVKVADKL